MVYYTCFSVFEINKVADNPYYHLSLVIKNYVKLVIEKCVVGDCRTGY